MAKTTSQEASKYEMEKRFGHSFFDDPLIDLKALYQTGDVQEYNEAFDALWCKVDLDASIGLTLYLIGLKLEVQHLVRMWKPRTISIAQVVAKLQEAYHVPLKISAVKNHIMSKPEKESITLEVDSLDVKIDKKIEESLKDVKDMKRISSNSSSDESDVSEASTSENDDELHIEEPLTKKEVEKPIAEFLDVESKVAEAQETLEKDSLATAEWSSLNHHIVDDTSNGDTYSGKKHWAAVYLANTPLQAAKMGLKIPRVEEVWLVVFQVLITEGNSFNFSWKFEARSTKTVLPSFTPFVFDPGGSLVQAGK